MTGFGRAAKETDGWRLAWEIRSVNGRHLDPKWRLPASLRHLETSFERSLREAAARGRVELTLQLTVTRPDLLGVGLNVPLAGAMLDELARFAQSRGETFSPDHGRLLSLSFLWEESSKETDPELASDVAATLAEALADWNVSRGSEGEMTAQDLLKRIARMRASYELIKAEAPGIKEEKARQLHERLAQALEKHAVEPDEARLIQEAAMLADKLDVTEELTRLTAHLDRLEEIIQAGGEVGKRLDFTLQECFREINTCGNKAQSTDVSKIVVEFKAELEKCREQVQNLE